MGEAPPSQVLLVPKSILEPGSCVGAQELLTMAVGCNSRCTGSGWCLGEAASPGGDCQQICALLGVQDAAQLSPALAMPPASAGGAEEPWSCWPYFYPFSVP